MRASVKRHAKYWVYLVECGDGTFYAGYTNDLKNRLKLHNNGHGAKYVRGKGPVKVVYLKEYAYYKRAVQAEYALKKLTRTQKTQLIASHTRQHHRT